MKELNEMSKKTLSYLEGLKKDFIERGWKDYEKHVDKQIKYLKKHGCLPAEH